MGRRTAIGTPFLLNHCYPAKYLIKLVNNAKRQVLLDLIGSSLRINNGCNLLR